MPVQSTHVLEFGTHQVTKRFRSSNNLEPKREKTALELLATYAPGLSPRYLDSGEENGSPYLVMSRLTGIAAEQPLSPQQITWLAAALKKMHTAIPEKILAKLPERV